MQAVVQAKSHALQPKPVGSENLVTHFEAKGDISQTTFEAATKEISISLGRRGHSLIWETRNDSELAQATPALRWRC